MTAPAATSDNAAPAGTRARRAPLSPSRNAAAVVAGGVGFALTLLAVIWVGQDHLSLAGWPVLTFTFLLAVYVGLSVWDSVVSGPTVLLHLAIVGLIGFACLAGALAVVQVIATAVRRAIG